MKSFSYLDDASYDVFKPDNFTARLEDGLRKVKRRFYYKQKRTLIVGAGWAGKTIAQTLNRIYPQKQLYFVDDRLSQEKFINIADQKNIAVLGKSTQLSQLVSDYAIDEVIVAITHEREDHLLKQIVLCYEKGVEVREMPDLYSEITGKIPLKHVNHHWIIPKLKAPKANLQTFLISLMHYSISLIGLLFFFLPLLPFFALAIKLDSKGPVFFRHTRVGYRGQKFNLIKFRTMVHKADKKGPDWTLKNDDRITRVGRFLRKFRLDELPQLLNVFKGEMSLIGPRPEAENLVKQFTKEIPFYEYRYLVKPGMSGWAQVCYENTCSVEGALEKLQYDLYWIRHRSLWLDIKIIFKSIKVMITGFGAV